MMRGDVVVVAAPGDYGKPRPAVVVQSDLISGTDSVLVCLLSSVTIEAPFHRMAVQPTLANGLRNRTQIMADKIMAVPRRKIGAQIGRLEGPEVVELNRLLALVLGLAD